MKTNPVFRQFAVFCVIGVVNTAISFVVFYICISLGAPQSVANLLSFVAGAVNSFLMNSRFTFQAPLRLARFVRFLALMSVLSFLYGAMGDYLSLNPFVTFISYAVLCPVLSFALTKFLVFSNHD